MLKGKEGSKFKCGAMDKERKNHRAGGGFPSSSGGHKTTEEQKEFPPFSTQDPHGPSAFPDVVNHREFP